MKIIVATPLYPPEIDTLASYSRDLAEHLQSDHQVTVLAYAKQVEDKNVIVVDKSKPLLVRLFSYSWSLFKLAKSADIIYAQNAVAVGLPAIIVKYLVSKPVFINFYDDEAWKRALLENISQQSYQDFLASPQTNSKIKNIVRLQAWVLRRADKVLVASQLEASNVEKYYDVDKTKIFINPKVEPQSEKIPFSPELVKGQIFFSGRLYDWSEVEKLIYKVHNDSEASLLVAGEGPSRSKLEKLVEENKLTTRVKFLGRISKAENYYHSQNSEKVVGDIDSTLISWPEHISNLNKILQ